MKSTPEMRARIRELMRPAQDDYDRAVACVLDDLESLIPTPEPQEAPDAPTPEFARIVNAMSDWRNADHEDMLSLSRHQAIVLLEGIKSLSLSSQKLSGGQNE